MNSPPVPPDEWDEDVPTLDGPTTGQVLGERYQMRERLGRGGMGEVWRAFDLKLRVDVALKSVRPDRVSGEGAHELLRQEVRAAREVVSANVCRIFDLEVEDDRELVSMEYIDGTTLTETLRSRGPLELQEAREIASQFLSGLEAIHQAGLVHRDFKPENVMLTRAGRVVVMDFGLAKGLEDSGGGPVSGTPAYMAPEQARGETLDARADVFAAGVVLAEMLTVGGAGSPAARRALWEGVRETPAQVPDGPWAGVLRQALDPRPEARHPSARALAGALEEVTLRLPGLEEKRPYPGLASFTEEDAENFFGREAEVEAVWKKLKRPRLLALIGPSGTGKSSFVRAGLLATLPSSWSAIVATPGSRPFQSLAQALVPAFSGDTDVMQELLQFEEPDTAVGLVKRWRRRHEHALVVLDQFEELFTLNQPETREAFAELLGRLVLDADVHVLLSLRDDFLVHCQGHESLSPIFNELTVLGSLSQSALRRAVVQPALACGYRFEDEALVEEMVDEVGDERGALPLLAFAASRLWEKRDRERGLLTREAYREIGGVAGALAQHAEQTLERIGTHRTAVVRELFRNLVTAQGTRAVREREELLSVFDGATAARQGSDSVWTEPGESAGVQEPVSRSEAEDVLAALVDARLVTSYERAGEGGETHHLVEIVHESLLSRWPRLVRWQTQDADGALLRDQLRQASRLWDEKGRSEDVLWSGTPFLEYRTWRTRYPGQLSAVEEDFARAMGALANRRRRRRRLAAVAAITAATAVAIVTSLFWRRAETEALRAEASNLLSLGRVELEDQPTAALAYAMASLERLDNEPARRFALEALWRGPLAFQVADARYSHVGWSPDGEWLTLEGNAGTPVLYLNRDASERHELELDGHPVGFTNDSSRIVTHDNKTEVVLWSFPQLERLKSWEVLGDANEEVRDQMLVTVQRDPSAPQQLVGRVRSIDGGGVRTLGHWAEAGGRGWGIGLLDSRLEWRASIEDGRVVKRRLAAPGAPPRLLGRHEGAVALAWYPWRDRLATADETGEVRIWNTESGGLVRTLRGPASARTIRLDLSGRYVAASPGGHLTPGSMVAFDLEAPPGADPIVLRHKVSVLNAMSFHPEGQYLATGNYPLGVLLWNLTSPRSIILGGADTGEKPGARFLPDGRLIHVSRSGAVQLWPLWAGTGEAPVALWTPRLGPDIISMSTSATGQFLAVLERRAGELTILPLDGSPRVVHEVAGGNLLGLKVAPDGRHAAFMGGAMTAPPSSLRLVDLDTGEETALPPGATSGECRLASPGKIVAETPEWLPDGRLVSYGTLGLRLWDLKERSSQQLWPCLDSTEPYQIVASPDGKTVLTLANAMSTQSTGVSTLLAFDLDARRSREITGHGKHLSSMALDETGTVLLTGDSEGVVRVSRLDGREPHLLLGHTGFVGSVDASPDGRWVASASADGTIRLWPMPDLTTPPLHTLPTAELLARLRRLTNLRVVEDPTSETSYDVEPGPFHGWAEPPTW